MTTIVAIRHERGVLMGADSCTTDSPRGINYGISKICQPNPHIATAASGSVRFANISGLVKWPEGIERMTVLDATHAMAKDVIPQLVDLHGKDTKGWLIVAIGNNLYHIDADFSVTPVNEPYTTGGNGENVALGCLWMSAKQPDMSSRARVIAALEAAAHHTVNTRPPWTFAETTIPDGVA